MKRRFTPIFALVILLVGFASHEAQAMRWYSPSIGRFLSRDPIGEWGGLHLYQYCQNSPIDYIDPRGLAGCVPENCMEGEIKDFDKNSATVTIIGEPTGPGCPPKDDLPGKVKEGLEKVFKKGKKKEGCKGKDDCRKKCVCDEANKKDYTGEWETIEFTETYEAPFGICTFRYKVSVKAQYKGWFAPCVGK